MSFRYKLALAMTVLSAILFSIGSTAFMYSSYRKSLLSQEQEVARQNNMMMQMLSLILPDVDAGGTNAVTEALNQIETGVAGDTWTVLYRDGDILYSTTALAAYLLPEANVTFSDDFVRVGYSGYGSDRYILAASKFYVNDQPYVLFTGRDIAPVTETRSSQLRIFAFTFVVVLLLAALLSWIMASLLVAPLNRLRRATERIADGDLTYRTNIRTGDEVGELSQAFDDMTARLEATAEKEQLAIRQKEQFMAAFTHELKTPMTSIIGYSQLLLTQELEDSDREDALSYIHSEAKRLENLSLKLLDIFVADNTDIEMKAVDPGAIAEDITSHLALMLSKQNIVIASRAEHGMCYLEPDLVRTLLLNIIDNARKSMEHGGRILVITRLTAEGVNFKVMDTGRGMPEEALQHITEAFYRVDKARSRSQGGAGLGLSLVARIVELHSGKIHFESKVGVGTNVIVELRGGRPAGAATTAGTAGAATATAATSAQVTAATATAGTATSGKEAER